ncbi:putative DNA modification/repair radical SAM protein [Rhodoplanes sp. TEM]|uniref:DNA modification/repair radical SAM protein n=1 Tax=Rhodoplanes tepidamans TaxID=200616 RepID=A0ABT5J7R7_RHOTP|nr:MULTISPECIES: putative DNA modification/repair radical SAM protein [Rhodoplanes]MDC7785683.1 putative DNA modification/repair radical SAM protein [Rhodoplanes tepidamans]MDC7983324.1 putative DNA modification/repair radical SAM protein [Rhodoplanes sp. TEM]MDQ0354749.1 putative DNA modification/repair radical SAM protein [Rhodoplanes tepidamans]
MPLDLVQKLEILADAAKYDASCASSGGPKRDSRRGGLGSTTGAGICHAHTPDGRCVSLLKILLTNFCRYDCAYCVSRRSSNVARAKFSVDEVVRLTLDLYRRNCIEGLFLSSGIALSEDDTMAELVRVAKTLRTVHGFRGYIHLKTIPGAAEALVAEAGRWADRLSLNVELPSERSLATYAPEKDATSIRKGLATTRSLIDGAADARRRGSGTIGRAPPPRFAPAGQSTQMIVGADGADDLAVLSASTSLYASYGLRRVYYAAFSPTGHPSAGLPQAATPLLREHRLYQADWLMRFYGFALPDLAAAAPSGMLDTAIDPKLAWALAHRDRFPVDVNTAPREMLLRVPGLGPRAVDRVLAARRRSGALRLVDLARLSGGLKRTRPFVVTADWRPTAMLDDAHLRRRLAPAPVQLSLF